MISTKTLVLRFDTTLMLDKAECPFCGKPTLVDWPKGPVKGFPTITATCEHLRFGMVITDGSGVPHVVFAGVTEY